MKRHGTPALVDWDEQDKHTPTDEPRAAPDHQTIRGREGRRRGWSGLFGTPRIQPRGTCAPSPALPLRPSLPVLRGFKTTRASPHHHHSFPAHHRPAPPSFIPPHPRGSTCWSPVTPAALRLPLPVRADCRAATRPSRRAPRGGEPTPTRAAACLASPRGWSADPTAPAPPSLVVGILRCVGLPACSLGSFIRGCHE